MFKIKLCENCKNNYNFEQEYNVKWEPESKQGYFIAFAPRDDICPYCKQKIKETGINYDEYKIISAISNDVNFLEAMIELKEKDIIEYQIKIVQFKQQAKMDGCYSSPSNDNIPKCPTCGSTTIKKIGTGERVASAVGLGIFSRKINKTWKCKSCGHTW